MSKRGLSNEVITAQAVKLIEEKGYYSFSLRELAASLGVKPASLYNHISGINEILVNVATFAAEKLNVMLKDAMLGKPADEAFLEGTRAYRRFAAENHELYEAFIHMPTYEDENLIRVGFKSFEPMRTVIGYYTNDEAFIVNFIRSIRSAMHGFVELTSNGFMQRADISRDETYEVMIDHFLKILKEAESNE